MGEIKINPILNVHNEYRKVNIVNPYRYDTGLISNPNMLQSPNTFTDSVWLKYASTIQSTTEVSPEGTNDATRVSFNAGSDGFLQLVDFNVVAGELYTLSFWIKTVTGTGQMGLGFNGKTQINNNEGNIINVDATWKRYSYTIIASADTGLYAILGTKNLEVGNNFSLPAITVDIWNAKLETGDTPT